MTDVKLNGMRELSFKEIEDVSGGNPWVIGGVLGGVSYLTGQTFNRIAAAANGTPIPSYSFREFSTSVASGATFGRLGQAIADRWNRFF